MKPGLERARRWEAIRDGADPDVKPYEPQTEEEVLQYLRDIGVQGVPDSPGKK